MCVAYGLITFGNKHASASSVLAYTALQPCATALLSWLLVALGPGKKHGLKEPGENSLGGIAVLLGLFLILRDVRAQEKAEAGADSERERLLSER